ncbi:MAG: FHA domain-containing protein [Chloroflexi bacterium]|nr:FHA domain-containing protein [Chloroflexota bacterium]
MVDQLPKPETSPEPMGSPADCGPTLPIGLQLAEPPGRLLKLSLQVAPLIVGRANDDEHTEQPQLDLSDFGALECGVSRLHAAFTCDGEFTYVQDLDSSNGTRINGFKIAPLRNYRLRNNDELELGSLRVTVRLGRHLA